MEMELGIYGKSMKWIGIQIVKYGFFLKQVNKSLVQAHIGMIGMVNSREMLFLLVVIITD